MLELDAEVFVVTGLLDAEVLVVTGVLELDTGVFMVT